MSRLNLLAHDAADLDVFSARLQDTVVKLKNIIWLPKTRRCALLVNRY